MIGRIIEFSARNQLIVFLMTAAAAIWGWWALYGLPIDALPELGDTQVIVYSRWDRSPDIIEDQVTYPITVSLLGAPGVKAVRGITDFGYSFVYVLFDEGTDVYWARSRTAEYLSGVRARLPAGVTTELGPDATSLGWVLQYVLEDSSGKHSPADLRVIQDWYLRYHLKSVPGVAEVASIGGFTKQYQVNLDPNRLRAYQIPIQRVVDAVRKGNVEAGGRLLELGVREYMVRGRGYLHSIHDIENIVLAATATGSSIRVADVGEVVIGPDIRRGVADLDGRGEAVSGIVISRQGTNPLEVIERVKAKIQEVEAGLPNGVRLVPVYDRSKLIHDSIRTVRATLIEVILTVSVVIFVFLRHFPSALIPVVTIPLVVLISFVPFRALGMTANIMSLGGIAIAIGALVDAAIVVVEQTHKKLEEWESRGRPGHERDVIIQAVKEVAGPSFFALLVIGISFLPVLTLESQEGRLFRPLAYTKTLCMVAAAALVITLDPALRLMLTRFRKMQFRPAWLCGIVNTALVGKIHSEEAHPLNRWLIRSYEPVVWWALSRKRLVCGIALALLLITVPVFLTLGTELMPPLDEGTLLYMPSTMPGISISQAQHLLQQTDRILKQFPEVDRVLGKAGRAETATDPAPLSMMETVITLRPRNEWRKVTTWYSGWAPEWIKPALRRVTPDHISTEQLVDEMNRALTLPGLSNAWTMPVKGRITMLSTGLRTAVGLKISGSKVEEIDQISARIQTVLTSMPGTRNVFAERATGGFFLDFEWKREELARYGLSMDDAQAAVQHGIGGDNVTEIIDGLGRYPVNVRYMRDYRSNLEAVGRVLVPVAEGRGQVPLEDLASISVKEGPAMLRNENGLLTGYVYVDMAGRDSNGYVEEAARLLKEQVRLEPGYTVTWSGEYQAAQRVRKRLTRIVPLTLFLIFLLLYTSTRSYTKTAIVALAVPFSAIGAIWLVYLLGYNLSLAVWVGIIALMGLDAETGLFMLLYLDLAYEQAKREGTLQDLNSLRAAIVRGAAKRIRPKFMTVAAAFMGLVPILWATDTGSDVLKRIAAPMIGGLFTSFLLELIVYPVVYEKVVTWKQEPSAQNTTAVP